MTTLRLLIACSRCSHQIDASGRATGSRLRCDCGEVLTVPPVAAHDARVVRCSSCGAPRVGNGPRCGFCDADFTLHERDLDTLCPGCMARISRRARFCHSCATPILVTGTAGEPTERFCPACGDQRLARRRLADVAPRPSDGAHPGAVSLLECGRCAGLWLTPETVDLLTDRARSAGPVEPLPAGGASARRRRRSVKPAPNPGGGSLYRPCPVCAKLMNRQNFGRSSGVIVDLCKEHGLWFDASELDRVLTWLRRGGEARERERREEEERARRQVDQRERRRWAETMAEPEPDPFAPIDGYDLFEWLAETIGELFERLRGEG